MLSHRIYCALISTNTTGIQKKAVNKEALNSQKITAGSAQTTTKPSSHKHHFQKTKSLQRNTINFIIDNIFYPMSSSFNPQFKQHT